MERLAKEKIAKQQIILNLRKDMPHLENIDAPMVLPDIDFSRNGIRERGRYTIYSSRSARRDKIDSRILSYRDWPIESRMLESGCKIFR